MTSKSLFSKLMKEDLKRRIWTIALSMLVFFVVLPINIALKASSYDYINNQEWVIRQLKETMGPQNEIMMMITIGSAVVCAISGFFYLNSRKKVDLHHSIPVRREALFAVNFLDGLLIYIVTYLFNVLLALIILQVNGFIDGNMLALSWSAVGINLLFYLLIYTVTVIAVMLTGNLVISVLGTGVFLSYGPILMAIKEMYFSGFFTTYYSNNNLVYEVVEFLSPVGIYNDVAKLAASGTGNGLSVKIVAVVAVTIILIYAALFLYKRRPSEAAGKAMAFNISKPIIKFMLVIPLTLFGGIVFRNITSSNYTAWFVFGMIFTLVVVYAVIQIIYDFDIRSAFHHRKHLLICAIAVGVFACIFQFDILGFDSYLPKKEDIKSMSVGVMGLDERIRYFETEENDNGYMSNAEYQLKYMELTDFEAAYSLAQAGTERAKRDKENEYYYGNDSFDYNVKYTLKGGRNVYRQYRIEADKSMDALRAVYVDTKFKEGHFPMYTWDAMDIGQVSCSNLLTDKELSLNISEKNQLLSIYREELYGLTLDEIREEPPVATLYMMVSDRYWTDHYIYPSFIKTIAFLKKHGFDVAKEVGIEDIKQIAVTNYNNIRIEDGPASETILIETATKDVYSPGSVIYEDAASIEEIFPKLISNDYYNNNRSVLDADESIEAIVVFRLDEYGNEKMHSYSFKEGEIPEFVKEDIEYTD